MIQPRLLLCCIRVCVCSAFLAQLLEHNETLVTLNISDNRCLASLCACC